ncbi:hypothetical protein [Halopseudomonas salina]|uniref:Cytochrome oxidase Cu insertion factor, SCO1/SenC/PrrC family n=1 Tax=Halopseudomonas salina TaxID=1323744 RepID=A0ABQ1PAZ8_9GAMM|nr:hypothetical protein [Halopseudomonas salina]GGC93299.1 hypothetical protein GCM10007418_11000 [Halopseudomonas salina]
MHDREQTSAIRSKPRGQLKLLAIVAIVLGPILLAGLMAKLGVGIPDSQTNRSDLIEPAISVDDWQLDIEPVGYGAPWRLLVTSTGDCEATCMELVHEARQINVALGREAGRVEHVIALSTPATGALLERLEREYPRLQQANLVPDAYDSSLTAHPVEWREGAQLWLIDPLGRVVLHQAPDEPGKQLLDDLKHLLKVSKVG